MRRAFPCRIAARGFSDGRETVEIGGSFTAGDKIGKVPRGLGHGPVGKDLLLQLVERLVSIRIVKLARLIGVRAKDNRKQFMVVARNANRQVSIIGADDDRHLGPAPRSDCRWRFSASSPASASLRGLLS